MKYHRVTIEKQDGSYVPRDEPVFILRAQDVLAPIAVRYYADLVYATTDNFAVASEIRHVAALMAAYPTKKLPD